MPQPGKAKQQQDIFCDSNFAASSAKAPRVHFPGSSLALQLPTYSVSVTPPPWVMLVPPGPEESKKHSLGLTGNLTRSPLHGSVVFEDPLVRFQVSLAKCKATLELPSSLPEWPCCIQCLPKWDFPRSCREIVRLGETLAACMTQLQSLHNFSKIKNF